jgi:hypothetical protein
VSTYDETKHRRGGNPANVGQYSPKDHAEAEGVALMKEKVLDPGTHGDLTGYAPHPIDETPIPMLNPWHLDLPNEEIETANLLESIGVTATAQYLGSDDRHGAYQDHYIVHLYRVNSGGDEQHLATDIWTGIHQSGPNAAQTVRMFAEDADFVRMSPDELADELGESIEDEEDLERMESKSRALAEQAERAEEFFGEHWQDVWNVGSGEY